MVLLLMCRPTCSVLVSFNKFDTNTVHAMALIGGGVVAFSFENVTQVAVALRASYFYTIHAMRFILDGL